MSQYQAKYAEIYKANNRKAVDEYQSKNADTYKANNRLAVDEYQSKNAEIYKANNRIAVDEYQSRNADTYKANNKIAVGEYQARNAEIYKVNNRIAVAEYQSRNAETYKLSNLTAVKKSQQNKQSKFPPSPLNRHLEYQIISDFCKSTLPNKFEEAGCAVCGKLTPLFDLKSLSNLDLNLDILKQSGVTQKERLSSKHPIEDLEGPVLDKSLESICKTCHKSIVKGKVPQMALANGKWLGDIPDVLKDLSFAEQLLIARVRHNRCLVRVSSGMHKMRANVISFANPTPQICNVLPPPVEELDEVLAFIYTGPCKPTKSDFERIPLLVRHNKVGAALEWLKLNHMDYLDLEISYKNLQRYPEDVPPVVVDYKQSFENKDPENTAVNDMEDETGVQFGSCPFVVHGVTGEEYSNKSLKALKAIALKHLNDGGKVLAIGHAEHPESIYNNPQLYPQMMPWLFPYGLGGIGNSRQKGHLSDLMHKRHLLMYHDKRFQTDPHFVLIAFNHEQIKDCTTAGYLLAEKPKFEDISMRLMDLDQNVLEDIIQRMNKDEHVKPETEEEQLCFQVLKDLDHIGGQVKGSVTSKKYMRNEIWSLISYFGAPSWFITFSPADSKHPICLYFADTKEKFSPVLREDNERFRLVAKNPVASARFFHFMCEMFIKHVLGVGQKHSGIYGNTDAYYGTVEQQGRLTLHLHLLLWIKGALSPQEIRDKIMDPTSDFQQKMVEYLESVHMGEFLTGSKNEVELNIKANKSQNKEYQDPTQTMPEPPPPLCEDQCNICHDCEALESWWDRFKYTVDDLIFKSNVHTCRTSSSSEKADKKDRPGCINKHGNCKARYPRQLFAQTEVDPKTGALNMKKGESWINTFTASFTYMFRCNTDVTSLQSGTAVKAIVAYISDYVTKPGLKTYSIFESIKNVFSKNTEMLNGSSMRYEKARKLMTQMVNNLTSKMEIGGPMAASYILGKPDHYTSHKFVTFYWRTYVTEVLKSWSSEKTSDEIIPEKIMIRKSNGRFIGVNNVYDYLYRPTSFEDVTLYEWMQMAVRFKSSKENKTTGSDDELDLIDQFSPDSPPVHPGPTVEPTEYDEDALESEDELDLLAETEIEPIETIIKDSETEPGKGYHFLKDHPLYDTHKVKFDEKRKNIVLNFVGGSLPRCDRGDREYYCATMLTLFKPWRTGRDLRHEDYTWDETFNKFEFNERQIQLMKHFNVRYECNDARDDYSAQLKQKNTNGVFPSWMNNDILDSLDEENDYEGAEFGDDDPQDREYDSEMFDILGRTTRMHLAQMEETEKILKHAGWLDDSPNGLETIDRSAIEPNTVQRGSEWKSTVDQERQKVLADRERHMQTTKSKMDVDCQHNNVQIVDQSYLYREFKAQEISDRKLIGSLIKDFSLNKEQERAFRIVANHSVSPSPDQLKMYLGGMGGTGKSQVIKSLTEFFRQKNQSHRMVVLGPTGSSAALIHGSTYHSFLGINLGETSASKIAKLRGRLEGVNYIFIDEVSMMSCNQMYQISAQLSKALNANDLPFGGVNMIFSGDFAQLPPVKGHTLFSNTVGTQIFSGLRLTDQEAAIGKALWHQITTVVILRENMRQKTQTPEDAALRTALSNMRYGKCSPDDIKFLRTLQAGKRPDQPKVSAKEFRNVAIICGRHTQKDQINLMGCQRFAEETGQKLTDFYSIDQWGKDKDPSSRTKYGKKHAAPKSQHKSREIDFDTQRQIWKLRPGATDHFAGKLSLCYGMPVMIRNNDATELCITKGQEGFVVGWQAEKGSHGKRVLDTLFVKLDRPAKTIQIPGLPENVVPIVRATKTIPCQFPSDIKENVERQQVHILPNFAMTDYASQGKTRPRNVVHLGSCYSHMSYYTCLSRSASAEGTIILQGFDAGIITRGCSGYLRQEFREHELLDEITSLRYEGKLSENVVGHTRNTLIRSFRQWKGEHYVPDKVDKALRWSESDPLDIPQVSDSQWQIVSRKTNVSTKITPQSNFVPARGSTSLKRKLSSDEMQPGKKLKKDLKEPETKPRGLIWDNVNYSCAYDSLFTIFYNIWCDNPELWDGKLGSINDYCKTLVKYFKQVKEDKITFEMARDKVRNKLCRSKPNIFKKGRVSISVGELASELLKSDKNNAMSERYCTRCDFAYEQPGHLGFTRVLGGDMSPSSTQKWLSNVSSTNKEKCPECNVDLEDKICFDETPHIFLLEYPHASVKTSHKIKLESFDQTKFELKLRGVVYHGENHFTSRIVESNGKIWYYDGMNMENGCVEDCHLSAISDGGLKKCKGQNLVLAVYA